MSPLNRKRKKNIRNSGIPIKPSIKGIILVFFGLYMTRFSVGMGIFQTNLYFGMISYFFLAMAGVFARLFLQTDNQKDSIKAAIMSLIMYIVGFMLTVFIMAIFNLNIFILISLISLGVLWLFLVLYAKSQDKHDIISKIFLCLVFTMGLLYGASLNQVIFPIYVVAFFLTLFFLQLSREYIKEFNELEGIIKEKKHRIRRIRNKLSFKKTSGAVKKIVKENLNNKSVKTRINNSYSKDILKKSLISQILAILLSGLILLTLYISLIFESRTTPLMFLWHIIVYLPIIGLASFLTKSCISKCKISKRIGLLLGLSILIILNAALFST